MKPTKSEMERLRRFYRSNSAIRTELHYLRERWPKLRTEAERRDNELDRAVLSTLLLENTQ